MIHHLKTWPEFYNAVVDGSKTFDIRKNDRNFQLGDYLALQEFVICKECGGTGRVWAAGDMDPCYCPPPHGHYTGRQTFVRVTYIRNLNDITRYDINKDTVVMSIVRCDPCGCEIFESCPVCKDEKDKMLAAAQAKA